MILRHSYGYDAPFRVRYYVRWMYEVSIFFIINIIFLKLILGIILDTFGGILGSLRAERQTKRDRERQDEYLLYLQS